MLVAFGCLVYNNFLEQLVNWFEYTMTQNLRPVYQPGRRNSGTNVGALVELILFLCVVFFPFLFFGYLIVSYLAQQVWRFIPLIALVGLVVLLLYRRGKTGKWPLLITLFIDKINAVFYRR